jgi:hypothetical protein
MKSVLLLLLVLISSCTVTKRVHRPGFHVEWHKNYKESRSKSTDETPQPNIENITEFTDPTMAQYADPDKTESNNPPIDDVVLIGESDNEIKTNLTKTTKSPTEDVLEKNRKTPKFTLSKNTIRKRSSSFSRLTQSEKISIVALITLLLGLALTAAILLHFFGPWFIAKTARIIFIIIGLAFLLYASVSSEQEINKPDLRLFYRIIHEFTKWTMRIIVGSILITIVGGIIYAFVLLIIVIIQWWIPIVIILGALLGLFILYGLGYLMHRGNDNVNGIFLAFLILLLVAGCCYILTFAGLSEIWIYLTFLSLGLAGLALLLYFIYSLISRYI